MPIDRMRCDGFLDRDEIWSAYAGERRWHLALRDVPRRSTMEANVTITPNVDGTFDASCDRCEATFNLAGEELLMVMAGQHDQRHGEEDRLATSLERAAALTPITMAERHVHGLPCTFEVCGVGPRRADLIAASRASKGLT